VVGGTSPQETIGGIPPPPMMTIMIMKRMLADCEGGYCIIRDNGPVVGAPRYWLPLYRRLVPPTLRSEHLLAASFDATTQRHYPVSSPVPGEPPKNDVQNCGKRGSSRVPFWALRTRL
jgi:hypothetical protein